MLWLFGILTLFMLAGTVKPLMEKLAILSQLTENLAAGISSEDDVAERRLYFLLDLGLAAGMLGLAWFTAFEIMRRVIRPIERVTAAMERLAETGETGVVPGAGRRDEIGTLARAIEAFGEAAHENHRAREFHTIVANLPTLIISVDAEQRYRFINHTAERWYGRASEDVVGRHLWEVMTEQAYNALLPHIEGVLAGKAQEFQSVLRYPTGEARLIDGRMIPDFGPDGAVRGYYAFGMDATAARERDTKIRLIADSMPAVLVYVDREFRLRFVNRTAESWYNRKADDIIGRTLEEVFGAAEFARLKPHAEAALRGDDQHFNFVLHYPDGILRATDVRYTADRAADGTVHGYYVLALDVGAEREADSRLRAIADSLPSLVAYVDAEQRFRYVNRNAAIWYATPEAKLLGARVADVLVPEAYAALRPWIDATYRGEEQRFETVATYPDGQTRNVDIAYIPDIGTDDKVRGFFALVTDTTALRQNDARLRLVADNLPAMIAYIDANRTLRYVNRQFETWYQKTAFDTLGKHLAEVIPASIAAEVEPYIVEVLAGRPQRVSAGGPDPDGKTRLVDVSYVADTGPDGDVRGFVVLSADVTATREADARLHAIADNLPVMIVYVDTDLRYCFVNRTAEQWYGRPASQVLGLRVDDFLGSRYEAIREHVEAAIAGEERRFETKMSYPDRRVRDVEVRHVPDFGPDGKLRGYYGFVIDVTERRAAEEQLRQAQKMESIGQLTGGIAHDFNNMLAVVLGSLELLGDKPHVDAEDRELIERAREAARKGAALTKRLLAFARKQQLRPQATDMGALVSGLKELLTRYVGERVDLSVAIADDLWLATIDPAQLEAAILNLVLNARDAMPNRGTVVIRARNASLAADEAGADGGLRAGDYVALSVIDNGTGMTPEIAARAFDPFFPTKEQGKGTGLGLSMVYGFAQQSGGTAKIVSSPGAGTTVTLYLPRAETAAVAAKIAPSKANAMADEKAQVPATRGAKVLVVDDNKGVRDFCLAAVRRLGHGAASATDTSSALAAIKADPEIAILLTDVVLTNGETGLDLAHAATRARPGLEVVFMSGYTDRTALPGGALPKDAPLLGKPFQIGELAAALAEAADRHSLGNSRAKGEVRLSAP